jgi:hypothetical protein
MGYCLTAFTYFLLCAGVLTQLVSFLTSRMQVNDAINVNKGLFIDCTFGRCVWFNMSQFPNLESNRLFK